MALVKLPVLFLYLRGNKLIKKWIVSPVILLNHDEKIKSCPIYWHDYPLVGIYIVQVGYVTVTNRNYFAKIFCIFASHSNLYSRGTFRKVRNFKKFEEFFCNFASQLTLVVRGTF
jgi:hypothetical protein